MNDDHYAKEAQRLLLDDTFAEAMMRVRNETLEALVTATGADIVALQQRVIAIDSILGELKRAILAIGDNGFDPNKRPDPSTAVN